MINEDQITLGDIIYNDLSGATCVYYGWYRKVQGGKEITLSVAVKVLTLQKEEQLAGLIQELLIQSKLEDSEYICKPYGYYLKGKQVFIVSEALAHDLEKDVKKRQGQKYTEQELLWMMLQVVKALIYAKSKNIAHRDIKPQNILFTLNEYEQKMVKLVDFGSGSLVDGKVQTLTGTPLYMSPEQMPIMKKFQETGVLPQMEYDPFASDMYSLGITFLHVALMEAPMQILFHKDNQADILKSFFQILQPDYPKLEQLLQKMLVENTERRISFDELQEQLSISLYGSSTNQVSDHQPTEQPPSQSGHFEGPGQQDARQVLESSDPVQQMSQFQLEVWKDQPDPINQEEMQQWESFLGSTDPFINTEFTREKKIHLLRILWSGCNNQEEIYQQILFLTYYQLEANFLCYLTRRCDNCHEDTQASEAQDISCRCYVCKKEQCVSWHSRCHGEEIVSAAYSEALVCKCGVCQTANPPLQSGELSFCTFCCSPLYQGESSH